MQFREKGRKLQCIRSEYIPERKRTVGRIVASQDKYLTTVSEEVCRQLEKEEVDSLKKYLSSREEKRTVDKLGFRLSYLDSMLNEAVQALEVDSLRDGLSNEQAERIWAAHERLSKALRRHGFKKPKAAPRPKVVRDEEQPGLPLSDD